MFVGVSNLQECSSEGCCGLYVYCPSPRALLFAGNHTQATTIASLHLPALLKRQCACMGIQTETAQQQQQQQLQQEHYATAVLSDSSTAAAAVLPELWEWQQCLESLEPSKLLSPCWQEMFAYNLFIAALRAFSYGYTKVGLISWNIALLSSPNDNRLS